MDVNSYTKSQPHITNHYWDIADISVFSTLGMLNHIRPHPTDIYESIRCFCRCQATYKESTSYQLLVLRYCWFIFLKLFGMSSHIRLQPPDIYKSIYCFFVCLFTYKTSTSYLVLFLRHCWFEAFWGWPTTSDRTHLIFTNQFAAFVDTKPLTKNQHHVYTYSWAIANYSF